MHEIFEGTGALITPTGSRIICNPPPMGTDEDFIVLVNRATIEHATLLLQNGFVMGGSDPTYANEQDIGGGDFGFQSFTKDEVNYILTESSKFYHNFCYATDIAKKLNLLKKQQRIDLFQIILYDNWTTDNC